MIDYYKELEISKEACLKVIKAAYKNLAAIYHPDVHTTGDEEKFKRLNEAYQVLSNKVKRAEYDRELDEYNRKRKFDRHDGNLDERIREIFRLEEQYNDLIVRESKAKSESEFRILAEEFRRMGDYEGASAFASKCVEKANRIKSRREERNRKAKTCLSILYLGLSRAEIGFMLEIFITAVFLYMLFGEKIDIMEFILGVDGPWFWMLPIGAFSASILIIHVLFRKRTNKITDIYLECFLVIMMIIAYIIAFSRGDTSGLTISSYIGGIVISWLLWFIVASLIITLGYSIMEL